MRRENRKWVDVTFRGDIKVRVLRGDLAKTMRQGELAAQVLQKHVGEKTKRSRDGGSYDTEAIVDAYAKRS